jgi:hypothetical protein
MRAAGGLGIFAWLLCVLVGANGVRAIDDWLTSAQLFEIGTYPSGAQYNWTDNLQGIASDGRWWYLSASTNRRRGTSSSARLYRAAPRSIERNIREPSVRPLSQAGLTGCSHIGDIDYRRGTIYVAIDGCSDGRAKVGMFRRGTLAFQGAFDLPGLSRAGGVAWNPDDGRLYALNRKLDGLRAYDVRSTGTGFRADFAREIPLLDQSDRRFRGNRNQGLKFSPSGRAYVVFDDVDFNRGGVYGFEVGPRAARLMVFMRVRHGCRGRFTCEKGGRMYLGDELEGLLIERITAGPYRGDVHVLMIDNDLGADDVYFRHHGALDPARL